MKPQISFIVPIYNNRIEELKRCIESVISLQNKTYEIILVDDGSFFNKQYKNLIERFNNKKIRYFYKTNGGVSSARNFGINKANGEYIFFIDADDILKKGALEAYNLEKKFDLIIFDVVVISRNGFKQKFSLPKNFTKSNQLEKYMIKNGLLNWPFGKLFKKDFLISKSIYFRENLINGEDLLFNYQVISNSPKIKFVNSTSYTYFYDSKSDVKRKLQSPFEYIYSLNVIFKIREKIIKENVSNVEKKDKKEYIEKEIINSLFYVYALSIGNGSKKRKAIFKKCIEVIDKFDLNKNYDDSIINFKLKSLINDKKIKSLLFLEIRNLLRVFKPYEFKRE